MCRINFSVVFIIMNLILIRPSQSQDVLKLDFGHEKIEKIESEFYVLDILDGRGSKAPLGIYHNGRLDLRNIIEFDTGIYNQLTTLLKSALPFDSTKLPVVIVIRYLSINTIGNGDSASCNCNLSVDFLTPGYVKFSNCSSSITKPSSQEDFPCSKAFESSFLQCANALTRIEMTEKYSDALQSLSLSGEKESSNNDSTPNTSTMDQLNTAIFNHDLYYDKWRIAFNGGFTYKVGGFNQYIDPSFFDYYKKLRKGYHLGLEINYFFKRNIAFGINTNFQQSENSIDNVSLVDSLGKIIATGQVKDDIRTYYAGPSIFLRKDLNTGKIYFYGGGSVVYMFYHDDKYLVVANHVFTGSTIGWEFFFGSEFIVTENTFIGIQIGSLYGSLKKEKVDGQMITLDQDENLSRLDFTVGIRFNF